MSFNVDEGADSTTVTVRVSDVDDEDALLAAVEDTESALTELKGSIEDARWSYYLSFVYETPDGERLEEAEFFEHAVARESVRERTATFIRTAIEWIEWVYETHRLDVWRDEMSPTLLWAAYHLALSDERYVGLYTDFIQTTDMDHEVHQTAHIDDLIDEHGWTPAVESLLEVRATEAVGQHGLEQYREHAPFLRENLPTPRHESSLFEGFLEYYDTLSEEWIDTWAADHGEPVLDDDEYDAWLARVERTYDV